MQIYIGTKVIKAKPMTRKEYNDYRGWQLPADEVHLADEPGQLVEYLDKGRANDDRHQGYISWSPQDVFEKAYVDTSKGVSFSLALAALKQGQRVARIGWNGKGMWLKLIETKAMTISDDRLEKLGLSPWIGMKTADGMFVPWLCSQTDALAEDWMVLGDAV